MMRTHERKTAPFQPENWSCGRGSREIDRQSRREDRIIGYCTVKFVRTTPTTRAATSYADILVWLRHRKIEAWPRWPGLQALQSDPFGTNDYSAEQRRRSLEVRLSIRSLAAKKRDVRHMA